MAHTDKIDNFKYSTGKQFHFEKEDKGYCAVRAIAHVFNVDYLVAYSVLANHGRKHGQGTSDRTIYDAVNTLCNSLGYSQKQLRFPREFRPMIPELVTSWKDTKDSRILICSNSHITSFVDGVLYDTFVQNKRCEWIISLTKINTQDMTTSIKDMTTEQRSKLSMELISKIANSQFQKDAERDKAIRLLQLLDKYEASDKAEIERKENITIELKF